MDKLAQHILYLASNHRLPCENIKLHKVMFFTVGMYVRLNGVDEFVKNIYDVPFEKWHYGACVSSIYYKFSIFGNRDLTKYTSGIYHNELSRFDEIIMKLLLSDTYKLIRVNRDMPAWIKYKEDISRGYLHHQYYLDEIYNDFRE